MRPFALTGVISLQRIMNEPGIMQYFPHTAPPDMERVQGLIEHQLTQ